MTQGGNAAHLALSYLVCGGGGEQAWLVCAADIWGKEIGVCAIWNAAHNFNRIIKELGKLLA